MNNLRNSTSLPGDSLFSVKWQIHSRSINEKTGQYDVIENELNKLNTLSNYDEVLKLQKRFNEKSTNKGLDWFQAIEFKNKND